MDMPEMTVGAWIGVTLSCVVQGTPFVGQGARVAKRSWWVHAGSVKIMLGFES